MKKFLLAFSISLSLFSTAQISLIEGFENETYPFTNDKFFRSKVFTACVGSYTLNKEFYKDETASTTYASAASNGGKMDISFKYRTQILMNGSVNGTMKVEYSVDGGQTYQLIQSIGLTSVMPCTNFTASLPQNAVPAGSNFKLKISGQWISGDYWLLLDDFKITQSPFLATSETLKKQADVYPNPFSDRIFINNHEDVTHIIISDMSGRILKNWAQVSHSVKSDDLKPGVYVISVTYRNGRTTSQKIVKK